MDPDEKVGNFILHFKVRIAAIKAIGMILQDHPNLLDNETFEELASRCKDKKISCRIEAMAALSKLFKTVYNLLVMPHLC
jgi:hypothetical protein